MAKQIRKDIDGLKGIAIAAVVLYHFFELLNTFESTNITLFSSGFLGVDIFLVLSGYLISASVISKLDTDSFSLKEFYKRRLLRILPPMIFMCLFTLLAGYFFLLSSVYRELSLENLFALTFIGNYRFAFSGGYFALDSSEKLLLHTWYLCITIQFYLICPILLSLLVKLFSRQKLGTSVSVLVLLLVTVSYFASLDGNGYLLTHTRIWEMFLGSAVYLNRLKLGNYLCSNSPVRIFATELCGIALVLVSFFTADLSNGAWHISTSILTVAGTIAVLVSANPKSVLSFAPLNYLGKISYSLYLWHWPLFIFIFSTGYGNRIRDYFLTAAIVYILTIVSYKFFEKKQYSEKTTIKLYLVTMLTALLVFCFQGKNHLSSFEDKNANIMVAEDTVSNENLKPSVYTTIDEVPVYHLGYQDKSVHTLVIGDSHAEHYAYYLRNINTEPLLFTFMHGTIGYGSNFRNYKVTVVSTQQERQSFYKIYTTLLSKLNYGDKVVIASRWDVYYRYFQREFSLPDNEETYRGFAAALYEELKEQIEKHPSLNFYVVGQGINTSKQVVNCLKTDLNKSFLRLVFNKDRCAFTEDYLKEYRHNLIDSTLMSLANSYKNVTFIDRNVPQTLGNGLYKTRTDTLEPIYFDKTHYTSAGGTMIGKYIFDRVFNK